ncbi:MAG: TetR/AcrR family transcriptional regulator [Ignavibacteriaceae bacterium]|nr:TetR/AcrR family transcriptional regulator [Ignavibacteriaceae bacterium]
MVQNEESTRVKKILQILSTAEDLFQRFGFKRITIEEICAKANVSKMTFYKYFPNKNELIKRILNSWLKQVEQTINEFEGMDIPFTEKIRKLLIIKEESTGKISKEFMAEYMNPDPDLQNFIKGFYGRATILFIDFIKKAQEKGEVRKEIKPEFLVAILNKMLELAKDETLINLYPRVTDFSLEVNNFIYCGILPLETFEKNAIEDK